MISLLRISILPVSVISATIAIPVLNMFSWGSDLLYEEKVLDEQRNFNPFPEDISKKSLSLANKLQDRHNNPTLCREILRSTKGDSWIRACRESAGSSAVEFEYYSSQYSMPTPVESLKFTPRELVIYLSEEDDSGLKHIRFDLTPEMIIGQGVFTSAADGKPFNEKQCLIEESKEGLKDWRVSCQASFN
ncbi:hypothetical protein OVS_03590 [Mycoplasma ovis str. Michigan]|uniref:Lipoprotein n=1 Tax=Mycoplasma ovis str. Michigan TaxID=1415773 RepID=A0ABM5P214_9MOLU|nr:hypothetical protein [Mycoplasma ovis]AHC40466.1 hypothetical protein OVS_03590 [Mycoplasma ovis str. Michigan]